MLSRFKKLLLIMIWLPAFLNLHSQQCTDAVFKTRYFSADSIYAYNHIATADNGSLVIGEARNFPIKKGLVFRLSAAGEIIWSRQLQATSNLALNKGLELTDGSFVVGGVAKHPNFGGYNIYITKLDKDGQLLWQKFYRVNNNKNLNMPDVSFISEGIGGDILVSWQATSLHVISGTDDGASVLMRLNAQGEMIWTKYLKTGYYFTSNLSCIFLVNGNIQLVGRAPDSSSAYPVNEYGNALVMVELGYSTGNIQKQKAYAFKEFDTNIIGFESQEHNFSAIKMQDGKMALFGIFGNRNTHTYYYKAIFDAQFNLVQSQLYSAPYSFDVPSSQIHVFPSGEAVITSINDNTRKGFYAFIDNNEHIISQKQVSFFTDIIPIDFLYNVNYPYLDWSYRERENNKISIVHNQTLQSRRTIEFTSMHKRGDNLPCLGTDANFISLLPFNITPITWAPKSIADDRIVSAPGTYSISDYALQKETVCMLAETCNNLKVQGQDTLCSTGSPEMFVAKKIGCNKTISWSFDREWITNASQGNDSVMQLTFKPVSAPVNVMLHVKIENCDIKDSLKITLLPSAKPLPADTIICGPVNMELSPGSGLKDYKWQDGSTNSAYVAKVIGMYSVTTEDHCGNVFSDDIHIREPFVEIGNDTTICSGDSIDVIATAGFSDYNWTAAGQAQRSGRVIRISLPTSDMYHLTASTVNGCTVRDSIGVTVRPAVSDFIFADTAICFEPVTLKPFTAFNTYLWNNGSTASSLEVDKPGTYWLQVTNQFGCKGRQEIIVKAKECKTFVYFPGAFSPNQDNVNDIFGPVSSGRFTSYWFEIYNRWGQKVFHTTDPKKGWDGSLNGLLQTTGMFVWTCQYQLQGEQKINKKGTVMLVR